MSENGPARITNLIAAAIPRIGNPPNRPSARYATGTFAEGSSILASLSAMTFLLNSIAL